MSFQNAHDFAIHHSNFYDISGSQNIILNSGLHILSTKSASGAAYDSFERHPPPECIDGTRQGVKNTITKWIFNPEGRPICWVHGLAGSGKSAIAQTLAQFCASHKVLAASFFFSRGNVERSTSRRLFTTISYQLTISYPELKVPIHLALDKDPSIPDQTLRNQLQYLVIDPLLSFKESHPPRRIIIIDALDECGDLQAAQDIITTLASTLHRHHSLLQVIITSRPEFYIRAKFRLQQISLMTYALDLHQFDAHDDIRIFLTRRFQEIYGNNSDIIDSIGESWPSIQDVDALVKESSGLFIFASTIVKFIGTPHKRPDRRLAIALGQNLESPFGSSPYAALDELYKQVLSTTSYNSTRLVLGAIILLFNPLSLDNLGHLLSLDSRDVQLALRGLHSILFIPEDQPVRTLHESLCDFLTDNQRSHSYFIDPAHHHAAITRRCLQLMTSSLRRNICRIADFSKLNKEITDLPQRCDMYIDGALRYACRYWAYHLSEASDRGLCHDLNTFASKSLLYWIETLGVLGDLGTAVYTLHRAQRWLEKYNDPSRDLLKLFHDAERFTLKFFDTISAAALQIYYSALPFTPTGTRLRQLYSHELTNSVKIYSGLDVEWDTILRTIVCPETMRSIAFSPDGLHIASGSVSGKLYIWDAITGSGVATLDSETQSYIDILAFSGTLVAFGCTLHGNLGVLDINIGNPAMLENGDPDIVSVSFFPDGTRIVSMSRNGTLRIWDATRYYLIFIATGQHAFCFCSLDSSLLSYQYHDHELVLWNTATRQIVAVLASEDGFFFPLTDTWLASMHTDYDSTVSIWNRSDERFQLQYQLQVESGEFLLNPSPVLSPTATLIGMIARIPGGLKKFCLWDAITGKRLPDVCSPVEFDYQAPQFSPNGGQVVMCDQEILRLLDVSEDGKSHELPESLDSHTHLRQSKSKHTRRILVSASNIISVSPARRTPIPLQDNRAHIIDVVDTDSIGKS